MRQKIFFYFAGFVCLLGNLKAQNIEKYKIENELLTESVNDDIISYFAIGQDTFISVANKNLEQKYEEYPGYYANFYQVKPLKNNSKSRKIADRLNHGEFHVGPVCVSSKMHMVFVTRNLTNSSASSLNLGVFVLKFDDQWNFLSESPLFLNHPSYSVGYPFFDDNLENLYVASNKRGSQMNFDIYMIPLKNNQFLKEQILDSTINSASNELFPSVYGTTLYFCTDRNKKLEIWSKNILNNVSKISFGGIENSDFFGFQRFNEQSAIVFNNSTNKDKVYRVQIIKEKIEPEAPIKAPVVDTVAQVVHSTDLVFVGKLINRETGEITKADKLKIALRVKDRTRFIHSEFVGDFTFKMSDVTKFDTTVLVIQYEGQKLIGVKDSIIVLPQDKDTVDLNKISNLLNNVQILKTGIDLAKVFNIGKINFQSGKWDITPSAAIELDKICLVLNQNPNIYIELGSHSDSRGKSADNLILSAKRAESSTNYIYTKGNISKERIVFKGYGEEKLLNKCKDGVTCPEELHAENRRTEFIIIDKP